MPIRTLLYHDVVEPGRCSESGFDAGDADIYKLTRQAFAAHLARLATIGSAPELATSTARSGWMITFDDGGASALVAIAPALEARAWRGHFFMTTGWLGEPGFLSADALRELVARGHLVGSHSHTHPLAMSSLSRTELQREWRDSSEILAGVLGEPPAIASIPGGAYSRTVAETAGEAGVRALFTSEPTAGVWQVGPVTCYGRYTVQHRTPPDTALAFATGRGAASLRQRLAWDGKKIVKAACGPAYRELRRRLLANSGGVNAARGTAAPPSR